MCVISFFSQFHIDDVDVDKLAQDRLCLFPKQGNHPRDCQEPVLWQRESTTALNSPASDAYMTLLRLLMQNTKMQNVRANPSGLSAVSIPIAILARTSFSEISISKIFLYRFEIVVPAPDDG